MNETWAWAAGVFEGEGCIYFDAKRGRASLSIEMTDEDVVRRFREAVSYGTVTSRRGRQQHYRDVWIWRCAAKAEVRAVLVRLIPYLGERRRGMARDVLGKTA